MDIHLYIASLSGNVTLARILKILREESYKGYVYYLRKFLDRFTEKERKAVEEGIVDNHSKIVEALKDGDEYAAINYVKQDLLSFGR
jgi:DNA-binding GntR family transcriptional regulator